MRVSISDPKITVEMYEAHPCALISGRRYSFVRVWKRKGDGLMTALDKEHGYSDESRYEIFGVTTWCELEARDVPEWALPFAHENFSIRDLPKSANRMRFALIDVNRSIDTACARHSPIRHSAGLRYALGFSTPT
jgi:hypothetical protein